MHTVYQNWSKNLKQSSNATEIEANWENSLVATKKNPIKKVKQAIAHPKKVNRFKMLIQKNFWKKKKQSQ